MVRSDANVAAFLRVLDPADNATGGGTASAVAGAMGAALVGMVARLSIGREGMEPEAYYREITAEAEALADALFAGGREDSEAFDGMRAAFRLRKDTEDEKSARSAAIQDATLHGARVPLANAERCVRVLELTDALQDRSNPNAASDLQCARLLAEAGLGGCLANVAINLGSIHDASIRAELESRAASFQQRVRQRHA